MHSKNRTPGALPSQASQGKKEIGKKFLSSKPIKRAPLALERIHNIERGDRLALGVFGVSDRIPDDGFEEGFEDAAGFFVDHWFWVLDVMVWSGIELFFGIGRQAERVGRGSLLAEIRLTPPRRARRRMAGLVMPWMLSRRILR